MKHPQKMVPSVFIEFFGNYPYIRVLDFLIENDIFDYSKKDICRNADVSWNTLETFWEQLQQTQLVIHTRKVGKAEMYKLNTQNAIVKHMMELNKQLMKKSMEQTGKPKGKVLVAADSN
ncbi:MAG: hypothetical protein V1776_02335 [Candidatus Diapherotrites archaeon]